ncbi:hypothetical protein DOM22_10965 [Bdellovibrio sp. ZAP7]|uniref:hypothetical protein n=1 Tax=Bdellovibrio sp. ZAP7 TaxID=2231053 RepID=UPI001159ED8B|nr:hypothetical protein [Bdellovibrio sp. ZAP7]QDK45632.1 hypothetical protein DOM22_10965 [Bdellovibrio sp. ZAP7]
MIETIYIKLLDEDLDVWRPVKAKQCANEFEYQILTEREGNFSNEEEWEFSPGSFVRVEEKVLEGKACKVAVALSAS